jgi:hypothetical protein
MFIIDMLQCFASGKMDKNELKNEVVGWKGPAQAPMIRSAILFDEHDKKGGQIASICIMRRKIIISITGIHMRGT